MQKILYFMAVGVFLLAACAVPSSTSKPSSDTSIATVPADYAGKKNPYSAEMAAEGEALFQTNCQMCHGAQGHGDGPAGAALDPQPKNLAAFQKTVADDYLFWRINEGKPGTAMVAWKGILTEDQIWKIISFIRTLKE